MTVAVRAFMAPLPAPARHRSDPDTATDLSRAEELLGDVLVLDTETRTDTTQRLTFGAYRWCRRQPDGSYTTLIEGIFYADDLPNLDPEGYLRLQEYARSRQADVPRRLDCDPRLALLSRRAFVNRILWPAIARRRALIVGFNLPFDLSRLAVHAGPGRGANAGGFSLQLWDFDGHNHPYRPRILIRALAPLLQ